MSIITILNLILKILNLVLNYPLQLIIAIAELAGTVFLQSQRTGILGGKDFKSHESYEEDWTRFDEMTAI